MYGAGYMAPCCMMVSGHTAVLSGQLELEEGAFLMSSPFLRRGVKPCILAGVYWCTITGA